MRSVTRKLPRSRRMNWARVSSTSSRCSNMESRGNAGGFFAAALFQHMAGRGNRLGNRNFNRFGRPAPANFDLTVLEPLTADYDPQRDADQVGVLELEAGPRIA